MSTANPWAPGEILRFYRCANCRSLIVPKGTFHDYSDAEPSEVSWRHYVQIGAGIDIMVNPAERSRTAGASRLLDVGCGFGFTLDYWQHEVDGEAVGVEPSAFGRLGAEMLGVNLHVALLADVPSLRGSQFDIVLSSEVIEHVPDPAAFIAELQQHLIPGGTLVLTTPNADFVAPESPIGLVLATLSPGLHKMLLSKAALENLLQQAGFTHIRVDGDGQQLIAWASGKPIDLQDNPDQLRRNYISYLARRWAGPPMAPDLQIGVGYRLFKETVNQGRLEEAVQVDAALRAVVDAQYGLDLTDPAAIRGAVLSATQLEQYMAAAPFPLGPILFFRAMAAAQGALPGENAAEGFALAYEILAHSLSIRPDHFQEAATLVWPAQFEQAGASLRSGQLDIAAECLARIAAGSTSSADIPTKVPPSITQRALALTEDLQAARVLQAAPETPPTDQSPQPEQTKRHPLAFWRRRHP